MKPADDKPEQPTVPNRSERRHAHHKDSGPRYDQTKTKVPLPARTNKSMHHPATRIGEIQHGK